MTILLCKMPTEGELFYIYISHMVSIGWTNLYNWKKQDEGNSNMKSNNKK